MAKRHVKYVKWGCGKAGYQIYAQYANGCYPEGQPYKTKEEAEKDARRFLDVLKDALKIAR